MGSLYQPSTQRKHLVWVSYYGGEHGNMKLSLVVVAVILAVLISSCEAQKGGAKSAMRNRGRGGSSGRGGTREGTTMVIAPPEARMTNLEMELGGGPVSDCATSENFKENRQKRKRRKGGNRVSVFVTGRS